MADRKSQPPLFHKMKGNFRLYICIHFCVKAVDKRTCLCFNVICIHLKDSEGKILPISMLQRAGGWCEPVLRVRRSGSRVGPVNEAPLPVMGHGFPRYRDRACRSPKRPPPGGNQGGTTDHRFVPGARYGSGDFFVSADPHIPAPLPKHILCESSTET